MSYTLSMIRRSLFEIFKTEEFSKWLKFQSPMIRTRVNARLDLISLGHFGDHKKFDGLIELRWKNGTRVYSFKKGNSIIVVLFGGNKNGQNKDIIKAKKIRDEVLSGTRIFYK